MSADGQGDASGLNEEDNTSTPDNQLGISKNASEIEAATSGLSKVDSGQNTVTFMGVEIEPFDENEEAIIEKKVNPLEKEKALDVDSELDFELKWDDDADSANDEQSKARTDTMIVDDVSNETPNQEPKTEQETVNKPDIVDKQVELINEGSDANEGLDTASNVQSRVFIIDTNTKIYLDSKVSPADSESSSLDGRLVYSDADVPEIEDKELLDEIDAQICENDDIIEDEIVSIKTPLIELEKCPQETDDAGPSEQILESPMDVDEVTNLDSIKTVEESDPNETLSTSNDLESSSYELNKEHELAKPDVMIEIPTQELIESFNDSGDMSDDALQYDEDLLLGNDEANPGPVSIKNKEVRESLKDSELQANKAVIDEEANEVNGNNKDITETLCVDDKMEQGNEQAITILESEDNEIATKTSKFVDTLPLVSDPVNSNSEIPETRVNVKEAMDIDVANEENHADIILDASQLEPELIEETKDISHITDVKPTPTFEEKEVISSDSIEPKLDTKHKKISSTNDMEKQVVTEVNETHDVAPQVVAKLKKDTSKDDKETLVVECTSAVEIEPQLVTKVKETHEVSPQVVAEVEEGTGTGDETLVVPEVKECTSTIEWELHVTTKTKETYDVAPQLVAKVEEGISTDEMEMQVVTESEECTSTVETEPQVIKKIKESHDVAPLMVAEVKEGTATDDMKPQVVTDIEECTSTVETELQVITKSNETHDVIPQLVAEVKESTSTVVTKAQMVTEVKAGTSIEMEPQDTEAKLASSTVSEQPSTSKYMQQELSDEDQEVTDSLGLLAESSRVMDDDDEQEQDEDDDDDEFDQDDESNQMTADHSEDSNAQHSETEVAKEAMEVDEANADEDKAPFQFQIAEVLSSTDVEASSESEVKEAMEVTTESELEKAVQALLNVTDKQTDEAKADSMSEAVEDVAEDNDKLPDDGPSDKETEGAASKLRQLLLKDKELADALEAEKTSPSKTKKLEISKPKNEINFVDLEESSSEDDIQEVKKPPSLEAEQSDVTTVNIPDEVEVMSTAVGSPSAMRHAQGEVVISGLPKPPPHRPARLNTSEVTIKTAVAATESLVIPEAATPTSTTTDDKLPKLGLEIFSLDSDDDENGGLPKQLTAVEIDKARASNKCINVQCASGAGAPSGPAGAAAVAYYGGRAGAVCRDCEQAVSSRALSLIEGIKELRPLLSLDMGQAREELVEISDSESDEEAGAAAAPADALGEAEAEFLEEQLASMFNKTWKKYDMDSRLLAAEDEINLEVKRLEEECSNINTMLNECQVATDKLRNDLYDSFAGERKELPAILIYDTPPNTWSGLEEGILAFESTKETRQSKRRSSIPEPPAKRAAIPLGYTPLDSDANTSNEPKPASPSVTDVAIQNEDDNADISVVKLSAEAAPAGLPPPGTATRPALRAHMAVYAMRNTFGSWSRARIIDVQPKVGNQFTMCRVKFEHKVKNPCKLLQARCLAYEHPSDVRMTIGTRLIALFKDNDNKRESYYSGIVAEIPNPVNNYRYLVFFDDGYAQYVQHAATRLVCECAPLVWDEVHPFSRQFVREYLRSYPERPMVRVHAGQSIKTEYNGKWWVSRVLQVDASLVQVHFEEEGRTEWIYRGSTRLAPLYLELQAAERQRARPLPRAQPGRRFNMPYVEYTRSDDPAPPAPVPSPAQIEQDIRRQRAVAKKSTAQPQPPPAPAPLDGITSRVVFYTPKNAIKPHKMVPHTCGPRCRRSDVLALKDLRTYNPLTKPLLSGWERQIVKFRWTRAVMYRAPCGRRLRGPAELQRYLLLTGSDMGVDLFDFGPNTHCLAEFVLNKCLVSKKDLSHGKENVPVPCVNYYDESLPEFCSYNTERTPTAGVPLNLDPEFLCGCDCTDDCADKSKCACWKMTLEGARTIGLDARDVGYVYKRLPEPLPSGIYECNSRCKCRQTCLNRVAQHPLQLKLQVFKTLNRGWGIRALNDIPKGAFLCVYAGNLLTDATANLDGLNEGDEYLAELDYIEVVEQMKEGFEEDIPDADKKLDKKESGEQDDGSSTTSSSEEEEDPRKDADDDDFRPAAPLSHAPSEFSKRLRKRDKSKKKGDAEEKPKEKDPNTEGNCITISDDEELREPARFAAQAGMGEKGFVSKYKSVRAHFGKDEACYIMDAKVQGNIGRYLNHSCTPNVFVQNVFVDTHDPRFPWVAFFALAHIRAGTELTWNYNYDVGSVPGKVLYCHCAAPNCRGRLL